MSLKIFKWGDNARMKNESEQRRRKINVKKRIIGRVIVLFSVQHLCLIFSMTMRIKWCINRGNLSIYLKTLCHNLNGFAFSTISK